MEVVCRPSNPEDDYFLTVCFVCEEIAKPGQTHMRNYGGTVCFSCRQFFRRAHQSGKATGMSCKNNGNCQINVNNRRKCQTCRYRLCRLAGMCPEAVLSEDQKKVRFQRMIRKREAATGIVLEPSRTGCGQTEVLKRALEEPQMKIPRYEVTPPISPRHWIQESLMDLCQPLPEPPQTPTLKLPPQPHPKWHLLMRPKVEMIEQMYTSAMKSFGLEGFISKEKFTTQNTLNFYRAFRQFSNSCRAFTALPSSDQEKLLNRNVALFLQMCISTFINTRPNEQAGLKELFCTKADIYGYLKTAGSLKGVDQRTVQARSVFAYILMFSYDSSMNLDNPAFLEEYGLISRILAAPLLNFGTFEDVIASLQKMSEFSSKNMIFIDSSLECCLPLEVNLNYSMDEEFWLQGLLDQVQQAQVSIPQGEDLFKEFLMFSIGVPPSKKYLAKICQVFIERIWFFVDLHPLSEGQKKETILKSCPSALILMLARLDVIGNGLQQCQEMFGGFKESEITRNCELLLTRPTSMKKFWLQKSCYNILTSASIQKVVLKDLIDIQDDITFFANFTEFKLKFEHLLHDSMSHKIIVLLVITHCNALQSLHKLCLKTVWRRMSLLCGDASHKCDLMLSQVTKCVRSVNQLKFSMEKQLLKSQSSM